MSKRIYNRFAIYPMERVMKHIISPNSKQKFRSKYKDTNMNWKILRDIEFDGIPVHMDSARYNLFKKKGTKCIKCGIEGKYFALEKFNFTNRYHFNLYGIDKKGKEIMITKDHKKPKSKGGKNNIKNYQTMCIICNEEKGNKYG